MTSEIIKKYGLCRNFSSIHICNKEPWDCHRIYEDNTK